MFSPSEKKVIDQYIPSDAQREVGLKSAVAILSNNLSEEFWHFWENEKYWDLDDLFENYCVGFNFKNQRMLDFSLKKIISSVAQLSQLSQINWCLEHIAPQGSKLRYQQEEWLEKSLTALITSSDYKVLNDLYYSKFWPFCPNNYLKYRLMILQQIVELEINNPEKYRLDQLLQSYKQALLLNDQEMLFKIKSVLASAQINFEDALNYWLTAIGLKLPSPRYNLDDLLGQGILDQDFLVNLFRQKMEEAIDGFILFLKQKKHDNGECWFLAKQLPNEDLLSTKLWQAQCEITDRIANSSENWSAYQMWCLIFVDSPRDSEAEEKAKEFLLANPPNSWYSLRWFLKINGCGKQDAQELFNLNLSQFLLGKESIRDE